uniref:ABC transporter domain-containing protein n=1 Tax=Lotharella globosa TaxID=91324 RepID=A0A7S3YW53_9EUKA
MSTVDAKMSTLGDHAKIDHLLKEKPAGVGKITTLAEAKKHDSRLARVKPVRLQWNDITFRVEDHVILQNLNGDVRPGEVCAMMGPSGSGKTTLMDFIAGRIENRSNRELRGEILLNGKRAVGKNKFKRHGVYVAQEESLIGTLTVRETLYFTAKLTMGGKTRQQINDAVEDLVKHLGLAYSADTIVGTVFQKGLSGGQKRRLSVALELLRQPSLLVLDEPTSGLDAASAFSEIEFLKGLASLGHTIIVSIHQPSSEIWALFDKVGFMTGGKAVYFGKAGQDILDYFETAGYPCPTFTNPADHVIKIINRDFPGNKADDVDDLIAKFAQHEAKLHVEKKEAEHNEVREGEEAKVETDTVSGSEKEEYFSGEMERPNWLSRFLALTHRNFLEVTRDPGIYGVRLAMYTMLALLIGLMWLNLGDQKDFSSITSRTSLLFYVAAFMVFMSVAVLPFFIWQRDVFLRERSNRAHGISEYVLAKWVVSIPGIFLLALFTTLLVVLLAGLNGFGVYLADLFLSLMVAEAFMAVMASIVPHYIIGIALAAGVYGFFMLCEGFFIIYSDIPPWFIWGYYIAFHTYSFRVFMHNEFDPIDSFDSQQFPTGESVLKFYDMDNVNVGQDLGILVAFMVFFQLLFAWILWAFHTGKR